MYVLEASGTCFVYGILGMVKYAFKKYGPKAL